MESSEGDDDDPKLLRAKLQEAYDANDALDGKVTSLNLRLDAAEAAPPAVVYRQDGTVPQTHFKISNEDKISCATEDRAKTHIEVLKVISILEKHNVDEFTCGKIPKGRRRLGPDQYRRFSDCTERQDRMDDQVGTCR